MESWWDEYRDFVNIDQLEFVQLESQATKITHYHSGIIPGLLQTEDYARVIIERLIVPPLPAHLVEKRWELRKKRQDSVIGRANITAIIDGFVFYRLIDERIIHHQIEHLRQLNERDDVSIFVVPHSAGYYSGMISPFILLEGSKNIVVIENNMGNDAIHDSECFQQYKSMANHLLSISLPVW
jgi:hypothetical protein